MECSFPTARYHIFMNNYFTSFHLLTHLRVNNIWATSMFNKNRLRKCTLVWEKQPQKKKNVVILTRAHQVTESSRNLTVVGFNDNRAVCVASSKFSEPKRFVGCLNKVEGKYIQENNQINSRVTIRTWDFPTEWPERFQVQDWYLNEKMVVVTVCLNGRYCSSECVCVLHHINKDKGDESVPLLA